MLDLLYEIEDVFGRKEPLSSSIYALEGGVGLKRRGFAQVLPREFNLYFDFTGMYEQLGESFLGDH